MSSYISTGYIHISTIATTHLEQGETKLTQEECLVRMALFAICE